MARKTTHKGLQQKVNRLEAELVSCRRAEEALRKSQYYLDRIIRGMFECFVVVDRNFVIKDVNEPFLKKYEGKREKVIGRKCYEVTHRVDKPCSENDYRCPVKEVFSTGKPTRVEHIHIDKRGEAVVIEIYSFPLLDKDGNVEHVVEVQHDVTESRRVDQERTQRKKLEGVLEMAGAVCHELSQPLQAVSGHSEILLRNLPKDHAGQERIRKVLMQIEKMTDITRKLRNITRYETKNYPGGIRIVDIDRASQGARYEDDLVHIAN